MKHDCNSNVRRALDLAKQLTVLADQIDAGCDEEGCAVMSGVVRDCAYTIRRRAELERETRRVRGLWAVGGEQPRVVQQHG